MNNNNSGNRLPAQVLLGIGVIGLGLIFLLDNFGFIDFHVTLHFWPVLFILVGILKVTQSRSTSGYLVGGGLILFGLLITAKRMYLFEFNMRMWWPLVLIAVGGLVIYKAMEARRGPALPNNDPLADNVVNVTAIMGAFRRRITTQQFRGGEVTAIMGGCELDLRGASIEGEAVLQVFAMWGGIELRVPDDWTVIMQGTPMLGGFDEKTIAPANYSKRLYVRGYAIMGGCEVRN